MASLKEIKDRIASVRSTLKITSAMKLVASAKLRKAQLSLEELRPYREELSTVFSLVGGAGKIGHKEKKGAKIAVVALSSNSSLCGAFNSNIIRSAIEFLRSHKGEVEIFALGRKMASSLRREGYDCDDSYCSLVAKPSFEASEALSRRLQEGFVSGEYSRVVMIYTHFVSSARQETVISDYLPYRPSKKDSSAALDASSVTLAHRESPSEDYIFEPGAEQIADFILPRLLDLEFHTVIADNVAAEHAARTLAMQTASDNAENLISSLTLEYNKGRQQKITAEILDLLGGSVQ